MVPLPRLLVILLPALFAMSCQDDPGGLRRVSASGFFDPPEVDFGVRTIGVGHELTTELTNSSAEDLRVLNLRFEPEETVFAARLPGDSLRGALLTRGSRHTVTMFYNPQEERSYNTSMFLVFSDLEIELPIKAAAKLIPPARPSLSPSKIVFGPTEVGRKVSRPIRITNLGETDGSLKTTKGAGNPFSVSDMGGAPLQLPSQVLAPGESIEVEIQYLPMIESSLDEAAIEFSFDTGESAILEAAGEAVPAGTLTCNGPLDFGEVPRGDSRRQSIQCSASGGPYSLADIHLSQNSSGLFTIIDPPTELAQDNTLSFDVDFEAAGLAQRHTATIELNSAHGTTAFVNLVGTVGPPLPGTTDLKVVLEWNTPWSDFDIHLVRANGELFNEEDDCHYSSKNPDWGQSSYAGDDPFLDRDDVDGFGPEELNLTTVGEQIPVYDLYVQYHDYQRQSAPATEVTLTYQMRDAPQQQLQRNMVTCGYMWHVGRFRFDGPSPIFELVDVEDDTHQFNAGDRCKN